MIGTLFQKLTAVVFTLVAVLVPGRVQKADNYLETEEHKESLKAFQSHSEHMKARQAKMKAVRQAQLKQIRETSLDPTVNFAVRVTVAPQPQTQDDDSEL